MTITKNLTANTEFSVTLLGDGTHVRIENRGDGVVYASKYPDVVSGADNVIAIDGGVTKLLTDVCTYGIQDSIGAYRGTIYLLADTNTSVEITTTNNSNFRAIQKGGGSGDSAFTESKNFIQVLDDNIEIFIGTKEEI